LPKRKETWCVLGDEFLETLGAEEHYEVIDRVLDLDKDELLMFLGFISGRLRLRLPYFPGK